MCPLVNDCRRKIWSAWQAAGGHPILDGLGCSELVYMVIGNTPQRRRPGSSGLAMPGVELRIVDEAGTILAEPGKTGRLEVRMPSVCAGYRAADDKPSDPPHQPEERFRPNGWFATGDDRSSVDGIALNSRACSHRAKGRINSRGSNRRWMKLQWQVRRS
jgi:long-subunit acyl-CoA synthetase (AMP-forming)